jgi:isopentenyl-diphosphate delta-isomerase
MKSIYKITKRQIANYKNFYQKYDISQTKNFEEPLILVDNNDKEIGTTSKLDGHLKSKSNKFAHRAFSVFLFNQDNKLLLQKRSKLKITFPNLWSNTCCSHPIYNDIERTVENNTGIKQAASRRMEIELGMGYIKDYYLFDKILYRANSDETFEEYECMNIY